MSQNQCIMSKTGYRYPMSKNIIIIFFCLTKTLFLWYFNKREGEIYMIEYSNLGSRKNTTYNLYSLVLKFPEFLLLKWHGEHYA